MSLDLSTESSNGSFFETSLVEDPLDMYQNFNRGATSYDRLVESICFGREELQDERDCYNPLGERMRDIQFSEYLRYKCLTQKAEELQRTVDRIRRPLKIIVDYSLTSPIYKPLKILTYSMHLAEVKDCYAKRTFIPNSFVNKKVLWFTPYMEDVRGNRYGNVTFSLPADRIFNRFGQRFQFVDTKHHENISISRILMIKETSRCYEHEILDISKENTPLHLGSGLGSAVVCIGQERIFVEHELKIGIEVDEEDCSWLYNECTLEIVDHEVCLGSEERGFWTRSSCGNLSREICKKLFDGKYPYF